MANPTSERRGEATGPEFGDDQFDRILGVDDKRPGKCPKHGDFVDLHCSGEGKVGKGWRGCEQCMLERCERENRQAHLAHLEQMERERIERMVKNSGIPGRFLGKTLATYSPTNAKADAHLRKIQEYADLICSDDHDGRSLILFGRLGTGKTHLGCALVNHVIRTTQKGAEYWTFSELVRSVKGSFGRDANYTEESVYRDLSKPRLVVLDEVGVQNFTEFEQTVAYEAINARYLAEKPTVLITNLKVSELGGCIGERVVDRLREGGGRALDFDWGSHRQQGGAA